MTQIQPPGAPPWYGYGPVAPPRTNTAATLALVLAFFVAPVGIVLGIIARRRIRRTGEGGRGVATAAIVLGIVFTVVGAAAVAVSASTLMSTVTPAPTPDLSASDMGEIEAELVSGTQAAAGVAPTDVRCPDDVRIGVGATFVCAGRLEGQPLHFTVTQQAGGRATFASETFIKIADIQKALERQVSDGATTGFTATCDTAGRTVLVSVAGTTIPCTIADQADPSHALPVVVTVIDADGNVRFGQATAT